MRPKIVASAFALLCATACASGALQSEPRLVFQTVEAGGAPVVRIYSDESVVVTLGAEELRFDNVEVTYPRWNGARYHAEGRVLLEVRDYRPCAVEGVEPRRTATVLLSLARVGADITTCGYHTTSETE
jgi:hypothetical protein